MSDTPLDELQWRLPEWIQAFGLRSDNVLEYFSQLPFFDRTSNNQVLKMQLQFNENLQHIRDPTPELRKMRGMEFAVVYTREPDFWVVRKQRRSLPDAVEAVADYYIVGANVYMAPGIHAVVSLRLLATTLNVRSSFQKLQRLVAFTPAVGHTYPDATTQAVPETSRPKTAASTPRVAPAGATPAMLAGTPSTPAGTYHTNTFASSTLARTLDNLLNISLKHSLVYLDDIPLTGPGSTKQALADHPHRPPLKGRAEPKPT